MKTHLLFCGDLVLPFNTTVDYSDVRSLFKDAIGVANLEGAILVDETKTNKNRWKDKFSLYSSPKVVDVIKNLNIHLVSLCNNHILDYKEPISNTEHFLDENGIGHFGLKNPDSFKMNIDGTDFYFITFATSANEHSLNMLDPKTALKMVARYRESNMHCKIIVYPHWGMERYEYPEPADRTLAHSLIDAGADIIIGHHPHCIQPIEVYKGHYIYYSIGNFIMPQTYYGDKRLFFKQKYILDELVVEWDGENAINHILHFDRENNRLTINKNYDISPFIDFFDDRKTANYKSYYFHRTKLFRIMFYTRMGNTKLSEMYNTYSRRTFRIIRRVAIKLGLHHPF